MSYTKQTWNNGDVITAEKLNHMEEGIAEGGSSGGGPLTAHFDLGTGILDKTWAEINASAPMVWVDIDGNYAGLISCYVDYNEYVCAFEVYSLGQFQEWAFVTDSENGYPVMRYDDGGSSPK